MPQQQNLGLFQALMGLPARTFDSKFMGTGPAAGGGFGGTGMLRPGGGYPGAPAGAGLGFMGGVDESQTGSLMGIGGQPFSMGPVGRQAWGGGIPASSQLPPPPPPQMVFQHNGVDWDMTKVDPRFRSAAESAIKINRPDLLRGAIRIPKPTGPDLSRFTPQ